ncbi:MAG: chromosomal replication initiator protein DnaA [Candidatus Melainabacteria bacterium]|nr:chromosomal replication initiator protein DnaA [Candidatus Melainabacteria bacterium]
MTYDIKKIWESVQGQLAKELKGPSYQTWIKPSKLISLDLDIATVAVKNEFNKNFLTSYYFDKILSSIEKVIKRKMKLEIVVKNDLTLDEFIPSIATLTEKTNSQNTKQAGFFDHTFKYKSNLNPTYTFENFVVGSSNQFCHAAALAIAEANHNDYNPLFIYGGVGLGKTHLVHAIANYALEQNKNTHIKYLSSESFTNELIYSIRTDGMNRFREKYRHVDLLMIDDVQFLAGKEATQEEFFHTFNTLKESGKQIILTADRPPSCLNAIADRLKNRFEGGLIADIQIPDIETRIAILTLKAAGLGIELKEDVGEYIATTFPNNIRELEGALKRIHAYFSFTDDEISVRNVQKVLADSTKSQKHISPISVLEEVASYYNISYENLIGTKRTPHFTLPRHVAIYILHDVYKLSFPRIGELLSNRTHSSAIYAYEQVKKKITADTTLYNQIASLTKSMERKL